MSIPNDKEMRKVREYQDLKQEVERLRDAWWVCAASSQKYWVNG